MDNPSDFAFAGKSYDVGMQTQRDFPFAHGKLNELWCLFPLKRLIYGHDTKVSVFCWHDIKKGKSYGQKHLCWKCIG